MEVTEKVLMILINNLWYLSEECAAFSIFDKRLSSNTQKEKP